MVRTNRVAPGVGACLGLGLGGEPSSGIFSAGGEVSRGSDGTGAGKAGGVGCTMRGGVSAGRGAATMTG